MSKYVVAGGLSAIVAAGLVGVWWWVRHRLGVESISNRRQHRAVTAAAPIGVVVVLAQLISEVLAIAADRLDRVDLRGTTAVARRETLLCVVALAALGLAADVARVDSRRWGRSAFLAAAAAAGGVVATRVDGATEGADRASFAVLVIASTYTIGIAEQHRPTRGVALAAGAAVVAAVLTERSPELTGLSITMSAAVVVAVPVFLGWSRLGWSASAALAVSIAVATARAGGSAALAPSATAAVVFAVCAWAIEVVRVRVQRRSELAG